MVYVSLISASNQNHLYSISPFDSFEEFRDESEVEVVDEILNFQDEKVSA
jgi:hypothetical protein